MQKQKHTCCRAQRFGAALLCAIVLFVTLTSSLFLIRHADHDCIGSNCSICACLRSAEQSLKILGSGTGDTAASAAVLSVSFAFLLILGSVQSGALLETPVTQHVRLNN